MTILKDFFVVQLDWIVSGRCPAEACPLGVMLGAALIACRTQGRQRLAEVGVRRWVRCDV
jgi:hypothetical protein